MTNDKILMNIIEAVALSMDSKKKSQDEAVKILDETMAFLKHRNPDKKVP